MRDILGFEGIYAITKDGKVFSYGNRVGSSHNGKFIKCSKDKDGYMRIALQNKNKAKYARVGRLVLETYLPTDDSNLQVNHINGKRDDDRLENLEWVTCSENILHSFKFLGRSQKGIKNACFKKWGYELNGIKIQVLDKTVDEWCIENNIASSTIYTSMREDRMLKIGRFKGYKFFRFGSTTK